MTSNNSTIPLFHVSAFARAPFTGNPAAVVLLNEERETAWMQSVAQEMNLSETAFVYPDRGELRLRWMTPTVEVDLCGHATLAAACVLKDLAVQRQLPDGIEPFWKNGCVKFISRSGHLTAESSADGITLDFPATPVQPASPPDDLLESLGVAAGEMVFFGRSVSDFFIRVSSAAVVRRLAPNMAQLAKFEARGIIVTSTGDTSDHDVISRFFAPAAGVAEDPVTGSAHCALASYWAPEFGRATLFGFQASQRGGHVRMELRGDRVRLTGHAILVSRGELLV